MKRWILTALAWGLMTSAAAAFGAGPAEKTAAGRIQVGFEELTPKNPTHQAAFDALNKWMGQAEAAYGYDRWNLDDPFKPPFIGRIDCFTAIDNGCSGHPFYMKPSFGPPYILEAVTMNKNSSIKIASFRAGNGEVHSFRLGDYIPIRPGISGRIVNISKSAVTIEARGRRGGDLLLTTVFKLRPDQDHPETGSGPGPPPSGLADPTGVKPERVEHEPIFAAMDQWLNQVWESYDCDLPNRGDPFMPIRRVLSRRTCDFLAIGGSGRQSQTGSSPIITTEFARLKLINTVIRQKPNRLALAVFEDRIGQSYILREGDRIGDMGGIITKIDDTSVTVEVPIACMKGSVRTTVIKSWRDQAASEQ